LAIDSPTLAATPSRGIIATPDPALAEQAAISALAHQLNVAVSEISVISTIPQEWSDTSLGCPQPGQVYPPVQTAGFLVTLGVGDETYNVHTDVSGTAVVCLEGDSTTVTDPLVDDFIRAAKEQLAEDLDVTVEEIAVVRSEAVDWSDSSLGCARSGESYAQVITPGYRIILALDEDWYEFHTDQTRMFECENPTE
jgi:hypothetical protein